MRARLALLLYIACSAPRSEPCVRAVPTDPTVPLFEIGKPFTFRVGSGVSYCGKNAEVQASIRDVHDDAVDVKAEVTLGDWPTEVSADLTFTAATAGPLHFAVRFEPQLALIQGELIGAERHDRPVLKRFPRPVCRVTHVMETGLLLCSSYFNFRGLAAAIDVDRGLVQNISLNGPILVAGNAVWQASGPRAGGLGIERWQDEGGDAGLVKSPSTDFASTAWLYAATQTGVHTSGDVHVRVDDGGWLSETIPLAVAITLPLCQDTSGESWWGADVSSVCRNSTDAGQRCVPVPDLPLRAERDGVWYGQRSGILGFVDESGRTREIPLPTGFHQEDACTAPLFVGANQRILAIRDADGGLHWDIIDSSYERGWIQGDRLYLVRGNEIEVQLR